MWYRAGITVGCTDWTLFTLRQRNHVSNRFRSFWTSDQRNFYDINKIVVILELLRQPNDSARLEVNVNMLGRGHEIKWKVLVLTSEVFQSKRSWFLLSLLKCVYHTFLLLTCLKKIQELRPPFMSWLPLFKIFKFRSMPNKRALGLGKKFVAIFFFSFCPSGFSFAMYVFVHQSKKYQDTGVRNPPQPLLPLTRTLRHRSLLRVINWQVNRYT